MLLYLSLARIELKWRYEETWIGLYRNAWGAGSFNVPTTHVKDMLAVVAKWPLWLEGQLE
jgi:hypothetical protein